MGNGHHVHPDGQREPVRPAQLKDTTSTAPIRLQLRISLRDSLYHERLVRLLIGGCGLSVDRDLDDATSAIELLVSGDVSGEDLGAVAVQLIPQSDELLDVEPIWQDGMIGVMQLVVIAQAAQILRDRSA